MSDIFISYRRDDSGFAADRIYASLCDKFGSQAVFIDRDGIPPGVRWDRYLSDKVNQCQVMLVVIGPQWLDIRDHRTNEKRLDQNIDFVRYEIEIAIDRGIPIIPLFLEGSPRLSEDRLPSSICELIKWQGMQIRRDPEFERDMSKLGLSLEALFSRETLVSSIPSSLVPQPFSWQYIKTGDAIIKNEQWQDSYLPYQAEQEVSVKEFFISKYPVTNGQFSRFIEDGGYDNHRWWTSAGWRQKEIHQWRAPLYWDIRPWSLDLHPVVGISWFEAIAYALWLGAATSERISLPSDAQWVRTARASTVDRFPWGDEFIANACNHGIDDKRSFGMTTPVNRFESIGMSQFGVVDLVGNVWEWSRTIYKSGGDDLADGISERILKGGSWHSDNIERLSIDYISRGEPTGRMNSIGFRIVRSIS